MPDLLSTDERSLSRRERERLRRRRAMLRAAQAVFAEKGYAQATLDEIAARAEFGKGTLYNYFENGKEEILFAVFDEVYKGLHTLIERFAANAGAHSVRQAFHTFVREAFDFFLKRESLFMMILKESHQFVFGEDRARAEYFHAQHEQVVEVLLPVLETAAENGEIRALPARPVAHMLFENAKGLLLARSMMDRRKEHDAYSDDTILHDPSRAADMLTTLLFDGLSLGASRTDPAAAGGDGSSSPASGASPATD